MRPAPRYLWLVALVVALALGAAAAPAPAAPFSFVAIADSQGNRPSEAINTAVFSQVVSKILGLHPRPALVLVAGDMVQGRPAGALSSEASLTAELRAWVRLTGPLRAAGIKVYCVPGNHEIWGTYAAGRERACRRVLGELQYAFQHEGSWFIGLNTDRAGRRRTPDLAWLEAQLVAAQRAGAQHIFVFGHEPAFPVTLPDASLRDADRFWGLLARFGADAYICGHEHLYGRCRRSGVYQVTTGGAGGYLLPVWGAEGFEVAVGTYNLTVWRVDGPKVEMRALAFDPNPVEWHQLDSFSYRKPAARPPGVVPVKQVRSTSTK